MRVLVAPDSYKGSLSAVEVAEAMKTGILRVYPEAVVTLFPIADGGEGTVEAMVTATGGEIRHSQVTGPLGEKVQAVWGILGDGQTGVIEMASASGLPLVPPHKRDPRITTCRGTGELVREALDTGLRRLILGIGGSATNDGGMGMARALGVRFLDSSGKDLPEGGAALADLASLDLTDLDPRLADCEILVACDVDNPLCGPRGASAVFGPQKGADEPMVRQLDQALARFHQVASAATGRDVAEIPGTGAAGGLGAGLLLFTPATLKPGVEIVLGTGQVDERLQSVDLVLTGEGHTDFQTAFGKAPVGVAAAAKRAGKRVICLAGGLGKGYADVLTKGIDAVSGCPPRPMSLEECMNSGKDLVADAAERIFRILAVGASLPR